MTAYEYCIENNLMVIGLSADPQLEHMFYTNHYKSEDLSVSLIKHDYTKQIVNGNTTHNIVVREGRHFKSEKYLELRMYTLVPYNISPIQQGIQHEHSVTDYVRRHIIEQVEGGAEMCDKYVRWCKEWKTSMVMNGGTSNTGNSIRHGYTEIHYDGSLDTHLKNLRDMGVKYGCFYEPDLNNMLTGVSFILDERMFNRKLYPDFKFPSFEDWVGEEDTDENFLKYVLVKRTEKETYINEVFGSEENYQIHEYMKQFRFA